MHSFELVLVEDQNVEPLILMGCRPLKFDFLVFKRNIEPFVLHIPNTIEGNSSVLLFEEDGADLDFLDVRHLPEIIDEVVLAHQVDVREVLEAAGVVVVAVDYEDGD